MHSLYRSVPEQIKEVAEDPVPVDDVSNGAGGPTEIYSEKEESAMELDNLTMEQLREGNPALYEQVQQGAVNAERERLSDIDALTVPGYEQMAAEAKANGTSAMDFQKQLVAAMKQKGNNFLEARQRETAPAQEVVGGEPSNTKTEEQEIQDNAKLIAEYAKGYTATGDTMF